ncbi:hypothetical protein Scep_006405 [Stephania cephalantha]|uniref:Uncharacterized protein n=1 Tax=Stephania cephalantha TaxID=152367 RepID=A0AAP0K9N3_9MAGN
MLIAVRVFLHSRASITLLRETSSSPTLISLTCCRLLRFAARSAVDVLTRVWRGSQNGQAHVVATQKLYVAMGFNCVVESAYILPYAPSCEYCGAIFFFTKLPIFVVQVDKYLWPLT